MASKRIHKRVINHFFSTSMWMTEKDNAAIRSKVKALMKNITAIFTK
jgi:hypothetical protein